MREWGSSAGYSTRIAHLKGTLSGGLNGSYHLGGANVSNDANARDTVYGGTDMDWFFYSINDQVRDRAVGEYADWR